MTQDTICNPHPDAPHGFNRNASHNENRYVCDCEGWQPDEDKDAKIEAQTSMIKELCDALNLGVSETTDYVIRNHLGDAINNEWLCMGRIALKKAKEFL